MLGENIRLSTGFTLADILTKYFALLPIGGVTAATMGNQIISWGFYPWQLITYQFMHAGFFHIFFNMFILWMFGMEIENLWGSKKFLIFYLTTGVVGGLFQILLSPIFLGGLNGPTIGASGSIMGVMVAFAMLFPNRYIYIYFLIPVKVKYFIVFLVLIDIFAANGGGNIAHFVHIGGALFGFLYMMFTNQGSISFRNIFGGSSSSPFGNYSNPSSKFKNITNPFKKKKEDVEDATYYDITDRDESQVSQKEIDAILDKISQSGYQNLSDKEKKILFEASKKMK
jgi:membrane associated rhomboid family serine protease